MQLPSYFFDEIDFKHFWKYLAWFVFCLIIFLRLWRLDVTPTGFYVDEASIAYNGYTLLKAAQDEYGTFLPTYFKAFGEYKNPIYIYLQVPFFFLFGVSKWSSRLVAALSFFAAAGAFALLVGESLKTSFKQSKVETVSVALLVVSSVFLVLPWTFALGRISFEIATFPVFFLLSLFYLHRVVWVNSVSQINTLRTNWFRFCFVVGVMFYTYTLGRYISPVLLVLASVVLFSKVGWKAMLVGWGLFGVVLLPAVWWEVLNPGSLMSRYTAIASRESSILSLAYGYFSHFTPGFLFQNGDGNFRHGLVNSGPFLWTSLPFLLVGAREFFKREKREFSAIILAVLLLTPIPAMMTLPSPHVLRVIPLLLIFSYWIGLGIVALWNNTVFKFLFLALSIEVVVLLYGYFGSFNKIAGIWFDSDMVSMFEATFPDNPAPYYVSDNLHHQVHITAQFVHAYLIPDVGGQEMYSDLGIPAALRLPAKTESIAVSNITQQFLLGISSGTVFLSKSECVDFYPLLTIFYQQVWFSEHSCAWRHN